MKILFLVPYPLNAAPSQRFRYEQYFEALGNHGYETTVRSFLSSQNWLIFFDSGKTMQKFLVLFRGFGARVFMLFYAFRYDFVFIHREITPLGPPIFEWILANLFKRKLIYDFDDAIWLTDKTNENWLEKKMRWRSKVGSICKWSFKVSCGNEYLAAYAKQFNDRVVLNPTTIDTQRVHNRDIFKEIVQAKKSRNEILIGWTGSYSTLKYLESLKEVLQKIEQNYPRVSVLVIADREPNLGLSRMIFKRWSKETEIRDLLDADIGIMPLPNDVWAKGKCGFKALQYMALNIPALASPVGVNTKIIGQGVHGFLCFSNEDWLLQIELLIQNPALRETMGKQGRLTVVQNYSVLSNEPNFLSLFS